MQYNYDSALSEMHILAYIYHWGRDEIRRIPRRERTMWVEKIIDQKNKENKHADESIEKAKSQSARR